MQVSLGQEAPSRHPSCGRFGVHTAAACMRPAEASVAGLPTTAREPASGIGGRQAAAAAAGARLHALFPAAAQAKFGDL